MLALTIGLLVIVGGIGCRSTKARSISISIPVLPYLQSPMGKTSSIFPTLEIFNSRGELIYLNHDGKGNAEVLKSLPQSLGQLKSILGKPSLSEETENLQGLTVEDRRTLLQSRLPTVVSIFLEECHSCSIQEQVVDDVGVSLTSKGINSVVIYVMRSIA